MLRFNTPILDNDPVTFDLEYRGFNYLITALLFLLLCIIVASVLKALYFYFKI